ncbi:MAG: YcjX family protein, partial [Rhodobacterales bacterium]|nr:YcjX family protein [Rhodobacterales bacterium]
EGAVSAVAEPFGDPVIRLGVTGLARAGKTVFITGLVSNLMSRGRMPQFRPEAQGRIEAVWLQPQPHDTVPRFDVEAHLAALTGDLPRWPDSTRAVAELRLSFRMRPQGVRGALAGPRTVHLDIVDYPGEWLMDLALMPQTYADWAEGVLARLARRPEAAAYLARARAEDGALPLDEVRAQALAAAFAGWLQAARAAGLSDCTPGRFLMPGDLAGSPALTFAPLPRPAQTPRGCLWAEMARRFEAYKVQVVRPFFRDHFARIDRQVVLVDALGAIHAGPAAVEDLRRAMAEVLTAFRPGRAGFLTGLLTGRRVERILFAATKADHLHHAQHARLTAIVEGMLRQARDRADFAGARTAAMAIAAVRATTEEELDQGGRIIPAVRGRLIATGRPATLFAGELPEDPARILSPAREGADRWLDADYRVMAFAPARQQVAPGEGLPHIRLDRAADFLIGDRL